MKSPASKRRALLGLKAAISLGLLAWLGHKMLAQGGLDGLGARLGAIAPGWVLVAIGLHLAAVLVGVSRWRLLLEASAIELRFGWLLRSYLIGRFVGAFTPSTTGLDGWRLYEVGRESGQMSRSAAVIALEKLVGLIAMATVTASLVPFGGVALLGPGALVGALAIGLGAAAGLLLMRHPGWLAAIATRAPSRLGGLLGRAVDAMRESRLSRAELAGAVLRGVVSHLAISSVFVATAWALGLDVELGTLLIVGNAITLAVLLPVSIGGVGVREGVAVALLATVGVGPTDGVLVGLLGYLTGQVPALLGGLAMLISRRPPIPTAPLPAAGLGVAESTLS